VFARESLPGRGRQSNRFVVNVNAWGPPTITKKLRNWTAHGALAHKVSPFSPVAPHIARGFTGGAPCTLTIRGLFADRIHIGVQHTNRFRNCEPCQRAYRQLQRVLAAPEGRTFLSARGLITIQDIRREGDPEWDCNSRSSVVITQRDKRILADSFTRIVLSDSVQVCAGKFFSIGVCRDEAPLEPPRLTPRSYAMKASSFEFDIT